MSKRGRNRSTVSARLRRIDLEVEAQHRRGDDLDVEIGEHRAGGDSDAVEAAADDVQCVLGT